MAEASSSSNDMDMVSVEDLSMREALKMCRETTTIETIIALTKHENPIVRQNALKQMCPCRVKEDLSDFWARVLQMTHDEADNVRQQVLHTLCDGSPNHMEYEVIAAVEDFNRDPNPKIRRTAHKVLGTYRKKRKWNIL
ncbi:uncharacterized protein LOC135493344 [Lineus longissimus]|uniref:uncharacterized protein LOC135493344 n=1 Tax=Lineus longissimus TaxID=88925 RepID=UPI002B4F9BD9